MRKVVGLLSVVFILLFSAIAEETSAPFTVTHKPPTGAPLAEPPFKYMGYYRTEVKNNTDRPLKIINQ